MKRFLCLGSLMLALALWTACGDTFRPIIIPNQPTFPDPRSTHSVIAINNNGSANHGSVLVVDVSGDSEVDATNLGIAPVHAVQQTASQVLIANQSTPGMMADSLMKIDFFGTSISGTPSTTSLPPGSAPNFVATTQTDTAYVLLPGLAPPSVGVVNTTSNALIATVPVGANPVAMAETLDQKKLYVANSGDSTVSAFNVLDRTPRTILGAAFNAPLWITARTDSQRVFVLNGNGTLTTLDTSGIQDQVISAMNVGSGAAYIVYDTRLNRLYIPSGTQLTILDASQFQPQLLATIAISVVPPAARNNQDPCSTTTQATALTAVVAAALPDESRAYVGAFYTDNAGNLCPQVTVINAAGNTIKANIPVPGFPGFAPFSPPVCSTTRFRFSMAAGGDSSRVYLSSCDAGNIGVISTFDDTFLVNLPGLVSARSPIPPSSQPPPQNPVFLLAGP